MISDSRGEKESSLSSRCIWKKIIQRKLKIRQKAPAAVTAANHNQKCGPLDIFCFLGDYPPKPHSHHIKKGLLRKIHSSEIFCCCSISKRISWRKNSSVWRKTDVGKTKNLMTTKKGDSKDVLFFPVWMCDPKTSLPDARKTSLNFKLPSITFNCGRFNCVAFYE